MGVSFTIMAHPVRAPFVSSLQTELGAEVVWDERQDRWDTGRRSMLTHGTEQWHAVIQDDAVLCAGFQPALEKALEHVPADSPLVLYAGRVSPYIRHFRGVPRQRPFLIMDRIIWGVGIVVPTEGIEEMVAFCDSIPMENYDLRLSQWFEALQLPVYYTWPSLVDHRDSPSLVPGRVSKRHAYRFAGDNAHLIDWSRRPQRLNVQPRKV